MSLLLRIYFAGMIAFIPGQDGTELHVVLVDTSQHHYVAADGKKVEAHRAMLLARASHCRGGDDDDCRGDARSLAEFLYRDLGERFGAPEEHLRGAISEGGAWLLDGSRLELVLDAPSTEHNQRSGWGLPLDFPAATANHSRIPGNPEESKSLAWLADISRILDGKAVTRRDLLETPPPRHLVAARLSLSHGTLRTHRLVPFDGEVRAIEFRSLGKSNSPVAHSQALAHWLVAELEIDAAELVIVEKSLAVGEERRRMILSPAGTGPEGQPIVELALLNVPPTSFEATSDRSKMHEYVGRHFEMYYDLLEKPPADRPVPFFAETPGISETELREPGRSNDFLDAIVPGPGRGLVSPPICPPALFPAVTD